MNAQMAAAVSGSLSVQEIARKDTLALGRFFADVLGQNTPLETVRKAIAPCNRGRLLAVADDAGCLMVAPFEVACDGAATVGVPLFHPRAGARRPSALSAAADRIFEYGVRTLHIALPCGGDLGDVFLGAGFLEGPMMLEMSGPAPPGPCVPEGRWIHYAPGRRLRFAQVFYRTLEASLDFPELPVCRRPARLMRALEQRGAFTNEDFALLEIGDHAAGIALLAMVGSSLEILYVGLVPRHRGAGLSRTLMARAAERAAAHGAPEMHVSVDDRNLPAVALYRKCGLSEKRAVRVYYRIEKKS